MNKFIRVHTVDKTILVNVNYIVTIFNDSYRHSDSSSDGRIMFHDGTSLYTKETRDEILKLINED